MCRPGPHAAWTNTVTTDWLSRRSDMLETEPTRAGAADLVLAEVIGNRLLNITLEMATTLIRTSGSPVLTEAKDCPTALFGRKREHVGLSRYVSAHICSSLADACAEDREYA